MTVSLPRSPTAHNVASAYSESLVAPKAEALAGQDGRLSAHEAGGDVFVADAHARTGAARPTVGSVESAAYEAMLGEAQRATGGDGRLSARDAGTMSPLMAQAFQMLRHSVSTPPASPTSPTNPGVGGVSGERGHAAICREVLDEYGFEQVQVAVDPAEALRQSELPGSVGFEAALRAALDCFLEQRGHGSLGILGMEERLALAGGTLAIESKPGRGTTVQAMIPLAGLQP